MLNMNTKGEAYAVALKAHCTIRTKNYNTWNFHRLSVRGLSWATVKWSKPPAFHVGGLDHFHVHSSEMSHSKSIPFHLFVRSTLQMMMCQIRHLYVIRKSECFLQISGICGVGVTSNYRLKHQFTLQQKDRPYYKIHKRGCYENAVCVIVVLLGYGNSEVSRTVLD